MDLPFRVQTEPGSEPVVSVDGAFGAPGLSLSHWPGNQTPPELKHDLSTGIALRFVELPARRQEELAAGCVAIANNHYDTDGVCAAFVLLYPEQALPRREALLDAARAGDLFRVPSIEAFRLDAILTAFPDPERSPFAADLEGLEDVARWELAYRQAFERLPAILDGDVEPYRELWEEPVAVLESDRADLADASHHDLVHLELSVWTAGHGRTSRRAEGLGAYDPGRHALFAETRMDRALVLGPGPKGTTARLIVNTTSWFDLPSGAGPRRPDLEALRARLDELEKELEGGEGRWHAHPVDSAAPELWCGEEGQPQFGEHNPFLGPSRIPAAEIKREVVEALRAVWCFPD